MPKACKGVEACSSDMSIVVVVVVIESKIVQAGPSRSLVSGLNAFMRFFIAFNINII